MYLNSQSDEFADVKAVKLLRRGRRLQQVECVPSARSFLSVSIDSIPEQYMARLLNLTVLRHPRRCLPPGFQLSYHN